MNNSKQNKYALKNTLIISLIFIQAENKALIALKDLSQALL